MQPEATPSSLWDRLHSLWNEETSFGQRLRRVILGRYILKLRWRLDQATEHIRSLEQQNLWLREKANQQRGDVVSNGLTGSSVEISKERAQEQYLDLYKQVLTRTLFLDDRPGADQEKMVLARQRREGGLDVPDDAETMVGMVRLDNVQDCVMTALADGIPGDLLEAGVWRGGVCIFMAGLLALAGESERRVFVADSFEGLPVPDRVRFPKETVDYSTYNVLAVGLDEVRSNFARYGLLNDRVVFLKGWFKVTLATAPIEALAVLRIDGDYYQSTYEALDALYSKVSEGGFVIIDDYWALQPCRDAVDDFLATQPGDVDVRPIDSTAVYWRKPSHHVVGSAQGSLP